MYLIVGLGNPEPEYSKTRHNMGFDVINKLSAKYEIEVKKEPTNFEKGMNNITKLLIKYMIVVSVAVFIIYSVIRHDFLEAILFSLSVAVGITPSMLPMIVNVNLTKGSKSLAKKKTLVKNIQYISSLNVRISHEVLGCADALIPYITENKQIFVAQPAPVDAERTQRFVRKLVQDAFAESDHIREEVQRLVPEYTPERKETQSAQQPVSIRKDKANVYAAQ